MDQDTFNLSQYRDIDIIISKNLVEYSQAMQYMDSRVEAIQSGKVNPCIWLLEHSHAYTIGTGDKKTENVINDVPVYQTNRGGKITYHGPGVLTAYIMINLKDKNKHIHWFVNALQDSVISLLLDYNIHGYKKEGLIGTWVQSNQLELKVSALGVRVSKWVTSHGLSLNVNPNLDYFNNIVPCDLKDYGVTSLHKLGIKVEYKEIQENLINKLKQHIINE